MIDHKRRGGKKQVAQTEENFQGKNDREAMCSNLDACSCPDMERKKGDLGSNKSKIHKEKYSLRLLMNSMLWCWLWKKKFVRGSLIYLLLSKYEIFALWYLPCCKTCKRGVNNKDNHRKILIVV